MSAYTAVTDPEILAKVQRSFVSAQPDLTKTTEVTDPELFQRIQDQLKKDLETQEEVELVTDKSEVYFDINSDIKHIKIKRKL